MAELNFPTLEPSNALVFSDPVFYDNSPVAQQFRVTVQSEGMTATALAWERYDHTGFPKLAEFVARMSSDFRGWDGAREWEGGDPGFRLSATHDRLSRITLDVFFTQFSNPEDGWEVRVPIALDPGTALETTARALRRFLALG